MYPMILLMNPCRSVLLDMKSIDDKIKLLGLPDLCNIHDNVMVRNLFDFDKLLYENLTRDSVNLL